MPVLRYLHFVICGSGSYCARPRNSAGGRGRRLHDTSIRRLRPYRAGAGIAPGPHLPRATSADCDKKMLLSAFATVQRVADNRTRTIAESLKDLERKFKNQESRVLTLK